MANPNRTAILTKAHRILKKHYKPNAPSADRTVLEHLLFACCLENTPHEKAERGFEALKTSFFDWNEARVSTVKELGEVLFMVHDAQASATNVKQVLQSVFESTYSFDLEALRKQNLGQAQQRLKKLQGVTNFGLAYLTQASLAGHSIPVDRGAMEIFSILAVVNDSERGTGIVPGLERAISKNKGIEFGSLVHELGADFLANAQSSAVHKILVEIVPDAKARIARHQPTPPPKHSSKSKSRNAPRTLPMTPGQARGADAGSASPAPTPDSAKSKAAAGKKKTPTAAEPAHAEKPEKAGAEKRATDKPHPEKGHGEKGRAEKSHPEKGHAEKPRPEKHAPRKEAAKETLKKRTGPGGMPKRKPR